MVTVLIGLNVNTLLIYAQINEKKKKNQSWNNLYVDLNTQPPVYFKEIPSADT